MKSVTCPSCTQPVKKIYIESVCWQTATIDEDGSVDIVSISTPIVGETRRLSHDDGPCSGDLSAFFDL